MADSLWINAECRECGKPLACDVSCKNDDVLLSVERCDCQDSVNYDEGKAEGYEEGFSLGKLEGELNV